MSRLAVWLPIAVLLLAFLAVCFAQLIRRPARYLPKVVWALIILVQIPLGGVLYLMIGRGEPEATDEPLAAPPVDSDRARPVAPQSAAVETHALTKLFAGNVGLHAVDLSVPARGVYGLVGPNGAGKTTLLSLLAGLRRPGSGHVSTTARTTLCPDTPTFEPWLTATETVELFRRLGPGGSTSTERALARAGLTMAANRRVGGFSRGMTQRLGLAVILASGAQVLLLDEPTSALDPQGRSEILDLITTLGRDHAVIFSSHILADVQRVADTVGVLREGRLIYQGSVEELLDRHTRPSWQLHLRTGADRLADRLDGLAWVAAVRRDEHGLRVDTTSVHAGEKLLAAEISASGAELIAFNPVGADLETVFLNLVEAGT
jgi:ABC-2 type transport system ATP-binding protein